jgi:hypothetical protein
MSFADPAPADLKDTLEEMRASAAEAGTRKGLAGAVQQAFAKLLEVLLAMLLDFRAGLLAPLAPVAERAGDGAAADSSPRPTGSIPWSSLCSPSKGEGGFHAGGAEAAAVMETGEAVGQAAHAPTSPDPSAPGRHCARAMGARTEGRGERSGGAVPLFRGVAFDARNAGADSSALLSTLRGSNDGGRRRVAIFQKCGCGIAYPRDEVVPA